MIKLVKCVLTIQELYWNQRMGHKKTKLNICQHMLTSSTQLQNRSFRVMERTRTSAKCPEMKNARAKRAKLLFFIATYANWVLVVVRSLWLKLPNVTKTCLGKVCYVTMVTLMFSRVKISSFRAKAHLVRYFIGVYRHISFLFDQHFFAFVVQ